MKTGDKVWWHYRSAIGHGRIVGIDKRGTSAATTRFKVQEYDHHPGEKNIVLHFGSALHVDNGKHITKNHKQKLNAKKNRRII